MKAAVARAATHADEELLYAWRNDEETRRWSRTRDVLATTEHYAWLNRTLADPDRHLWVVESAVAPVATVRHDRIAPRRYEVSLTVAPGSRGQGWAGAALASAQLALERTEPELELIQAHVQADNSASLAVFERAGYQRVGTRHGLLRLELVVKVR